MTQLNTPPTTLLVDSHCHLHNIGDLSALLDHAAKQFSKTAGKNNISGNWYGVLILTDVSKSTAFRHIQYMIQSNAEKILSSDQWDLKLTEEDASILAENNKGTSIFLCAGQQIVTKEKLEVLSLLNTTRVADGKTLDHTIKEVTEQGGLPTLPWGVGKWLGKRGTLVNDLILNHPSTPLFLGDNSGRPILWSRVPQFSLAKQYQIPILRGTDPLPVKKQKKRGGDFGFIISGDSNLNKPAESLRHMLVQKNLTLTDYGRLENPVRFLTEQIGIRFPSKSTKNDKISTK